MTDPVATVRRYFAAFAAGDIEVALGCVAPGAVWHVDGDPIVGTVGIVRGRDRIGEWLRRFPDNFQPLAFTVERLIGADYDVIALGHFRHRVIPTGAIVDSDYVIRFTVVDGLIERYQIFEDSLLIAGAFTDATSARSAVVNGTTYGWQDTGSGAPTVFLHGLFLDAGFWDRQVLDLASERRCIAFDMPGHGTSGWRAGLDLDGIAEDIALWMREHAAVSATIVGHSQGGMIAMRIAARHPELVARLVLVNTSARAEPASSHEAWTKRRRQLLANDETRAAAFDGIQKLTTSVAWLDENSSAAAEEHSVMMRHDPPMLVQALDAAVLGRADIRHLLPGITSEAIVLSGGADQPTPSALGEEIAAMIPGARHLLIEQAAHHLPTEAPHALVEAIRTPIW